jgi:hypothetical protein
MRSRSILSTLSIRHAVNTASPPPTPTPALMRH